MPAQAGLIETFAGGGANSGDLGDDGVATSATLSYPSNVRFDSAGNLYIADRNNQRIRKVATGTGVITTVAGNGLVAFSGDGGAATSASLSYPSNITLDSVGNLYIADRSNHRVRKVAAGTGVITTVAGTGSPSYGGDGGAATSARMYAPGGIVVDSAGNLYIADSNNHRIRKVAAGTGLISTVAGNGTYGYSGDGGPATLANLANPNGLAMDGAGNLYIADTNKQRIRKVEAGTGVISTVAGNGVQSYAGDGGPALSASLNYPYDVALDSTGNLYIADMFNNRIRKVAADTGIITTVAGNGTSGFSGDGDSATLASLDNPSGVALDSDGNIYIADINNNRIRRLYIASQTITFPALTDKTLGAAEFTVSATASSGLAPSFASQTSSVCMVTGDTVQLVGRGTCTLRASQAGNADYLAALDVDRSFFVYQNVGINDTGQSLCYDAAGGTVACSSSSFPRQDGRYGRDPASPAKLGSGDSGFDYTALDANGNPTAFGSGATPHPCVRDNVTGLVWEVKTNDGGLHDKDWDYTWYSTNSATNGANMGTASGGNCGGTLLDGCDTEKFVAAVNAEGWCGYHDWRMPTRKELAGLVHYGVTSPIIDVTRFPNTLSRPYWTQTSYAQNTASVWLVYFSAGSGAPTPKASRVGIRLVRGGL